MSCTAMMVLLMVGASVLGGLLGYAIKSSAIKKQQLTPQKAKSKSGKSASETLEAKQKELSRIKEKYESLYESKLDVDTALMAAESTLDGIKLDYEKLERESSKSKDHIN